MMARRWLYGVGPGFVEPVAEVWAQTGRKEVAPRKSAKAAQRRLRGMKCIAEMLAGATGLSRLGGDLAG
jgi:hypothetical protein